MKIVWSNGDIWQPASDRGFKLGFRDKLPHGIKVRVIIGNLETIVMINTRCVVNDYEMHKR